MMRGLWRLTWVEIRIFLREPLGAIGTFVPVIVFLVLGRVTEYMIARGGPETAAAVARGSATRPDLPVLAAMLIALNAVLSLVSVISIYREGGILKRLRATPLRPQTILTAQVLVKLFFTAVTVASISSQPWSVFAPLLANLIPSTSPGWTSAMERTTPPSRVRKVTA